jgi:hypothetical protein
MVRSNHPSTRFKLAQGRPFATPQHRLSPIAYRLSPIAYRLFAKRCAALFWQHEIADNCAKVITAGDELSEGSSSGAERVEGF